MTPDKPWFCEDPDGEGTSWHATQEEALAAAAKTLAIWGEEGCPRAQDIEIIRVGYITHRAMQTHVQRQQGVLGENCTAESGIYWDYDCDYRCDYTMMPLA